MKAILMTVLLVCAVFTGACSHSDQEPKTIVATTPIPNLKADAERLQQATAKAAEERKRADAAATPIAALPTEASPAATAPQS